MSRRRIPRCQQEPKFDRRVRAYAARRLGLRSGWAMLADTQVSRRTEPAQPPGKRNGLYGARRVPKQKIGDFEQARGIEPQSVSERQILRPRAVKKYGFGVKVDALETPGSPYPSAPPPVRPSPKRSFPITPPGGDHGEKRIVSV